MGARIAKAGVTSYTTASKWNGKTIDITPQHQALPYHPQIESSSSSHTSQTSSASSQTNTASAASKGKLKAPSSGDSSSSSSTSSGGYVPENHPLQLTYDPSAKPQNVVFLKPDHHPIAGELMSSQSATARDIVISNPYMARRYIREVENITGRNIDPKQITLLKENLQEREFTKLSPADQKTHRAEFDKMRPTLREDWMYETGQTWPIYENAIYDRKGEIFKDTGILYDAHHIIPVNHGGPNEWWNLHPASQPEHAKVHGSGSSASKIFVKPYSNSTNNQQTNSLVMDEELLEAKVKGKVMENSKETSNSSNNKASSTTKRLENIEQSSFLNQKKLLFTIKVEYLKSKVSENNDESLSALAEDYIGALLWWLDYVATTWIRAIVMQSLIIKELYKHFRTHETYKIDTKIVIEDITNMDEQEQNEFSVDNVISALNEQAKMSEVKDNETSKPSEEVILDKDTIAIVHNKNEVIDIISEEIRDNELKELSSMQWNATITATDKNYNHCLVEERFEINIDYLKQILLNIEKTDIHIINNQDNYSTSIEKYNNFCREEVYLEYASNLKILGETY